MEDYTGQSRFKVKEFSAYSESEVNKAVIEFQKWLDSEWNLREIIDIRMTSVAVKLNNSIYDYIRDSVVVVYRTLIDDKEENSSS